MAYLKRQVLIHLLQLQEVKIELSMELYIHQQVIKILSNQATLVKLAQVQGMVLRELKDQEVKFVFPTVWRKGFKLNGKRADAKAKAIELCKELGYEVECDDDAEAILLGIYFQKGVDKETLI